MADSTGDMTAIIIIDSTTSDDEYFATAVSNSMVSDFGVAMGPLSSKCNSIGGQFDSIRDQISDIGANATPSGYFNNAVVNGLNESYKSSGWAQKPEAVNKSKGVLDKCPYFKNNAAQNPKYSDPYKHIKSLGSAAAETAEKAIDDVLDSLKSSTGYQYLEATIGKQIAAIASTGRTLYDKVEPFVSDIDEAISPVIEYGKGAVNVMKTELSAATKELANMDQLINCLDSVGGSSFATQVDEMNDQMNCYYDKLGVFSDPALPNFGEFDVDSFLGGIGSLDTDTSNNIKKSINMFSKSKANAQGAISKVSELGEVTPSALSPAAGDPASISQKKTEITSKVKTTYTIPGIPGKTETKTVDAPAPVPVGPPEPVDPPPPVQGKVAYTTFIKQTEFVSDSSGYDEVDPNHAQSNVYISAAYKTITAEFEEPETLPKIKLTSTVVGIAFANEEDTNWLGNPQYLLWVNVKVGVTLENIDSGRSVYKEYTLKGKNIEWTTNASDLTDPTYKAPLLFRTVKLAHSFINFYTEDVQYTLF